MMTAGHVEDWQWETVLGVRVPKISATERLAWAHLGRQNFLSFEECVIEKALYRKIQYRKNKLSQRTQRCNLRRIK